MGFRDDHVCIDEAGIVLFLLGILWLAFEGFVALRHWLHS